MTKPRYRFTICIFSKAKQGLDWWVRENWKSDLYSEKVLHQRNDNEKCILAIKTND